mgnify:FL=1|tara:strand:- start:11124 stop:11768 length:645 start_codon:yes stop_codon:yes gene_type:complete
MDYIREIIDIDSDLIIFVIEMVIISLLGFSFHITFSFLKFDWIKSTFQLLNFLLLAPIGYAITSSISSNIALSLGMVGALSIIRFRTPVKNSFELVVYFLLLTIGITGSVDIMVSITLTIFVNVIILLVSYIKKLNPNREVFESSYLNDYRNFLSISTDKEIDTENFELVSFDYKDNLYDYVLSGNKEDLLTFQNDLIKTNNENIKKISSNFYN